MRILEIQKDQQLLQPKQDPIQLTPVKQDHLQDISYLHPKIWWKRK